MNNFNLILLLQIKHKVRKKKYSIKILTKLFAIMTFHRNMELGICYQMEVTVLYLMIELH
jgi:hypothetical protein